MWSSEVGAPLLAITTSTASLDEPGFQFGCKAPCDDLKNQHGGNLDIRAVYLDNPNRDGKGAEKMFGLACGVPGARCFFPFLLTIACLLYTSPSPRD